MPSVNKVFLMGNLGQDPKMIVSEKIHGPIRRETGQRKPPGMIASYSVNVYVI